MESVRCNLCGSDDHRIVYSMPDARYFINELFDVVECRHCGLGFVNPRPTIAEMSRYYPPSFYDVFDKERDYHQRRYAAEAKFLLDMVSHGNKFLLDLGCANGDFPRFMQRLGWSVEGVEVSPNSKSIREFKLYKQEFEEIPVYGPRYDVVTAWAVLEHVHDPMAYFKKAAQVLKPGGIFVFLVTNFESSSSRHLYLEDVPRHLFFFTESTVNKYLSLSGFDLVKKDYSNKIYSMRPVNFLSYYLARCVRKRKLEWQDTRIASLQGGEKRNFQRRVMNGLRLLISHPIYLVDRMLMPIYERYQLISNTYGIVTYVARRD